MKKVTLLFAALATAIFLISVSSCKKVYDYTENRPDIATCCRIELFDYTMNFNSQLTKAVFTYNEFGNPVKIEHPDVEIAPDYNFYFKYDKFHRLATYKRTYMKDDGSGFLLCNKYTYLDRYTIIDSFFAYGDGWPDHPVGDEGSVSASIIKLDKYGRIINKDISYNEEGNLVYRAISFNYDSGKRSAMI